MRKTIQHVAAWSPDVARLIAGSGDLPELPRLIVRAITTLIPTNIAYVGVHHVRRLHRELYIYPEGFQQPADYSAELYTLDPFYQAYQKGQTGSFHLLEIAPSGFTETEYFKKFYTAEGIVDELLYITEVPDGGFIGIGISRSERHGRFTQEERELHRAMFPVVEAASLQLVRLLTESGQPLHAGEDVEDALNLFGADLLTPREQEVVHLVLRGHNTQSVANVLEIASDTVKLHRKHAYAKLRVSSQGELFYKFLESLGLHD